MFPLPIQLASNLWCDMLQARNLDKHVKEECPMELVPCDFQLTGCPRRVARRALKEHNSENIEFHLGLMNRAAVQVRCISYA